MKRIFVLCSMVFLCFCGIVHGENVFNNASISIECAEGDFVVNGSFDCSSVDVSNYNVYVEIETEDGTKRKMDVSEDFAIEKGTNNFNFETDIPFELQNVKVSVLTKAGEQICAAEKKSVRSLKILALGNSFSDDAMRYLYWIADDYGIDSIVLGKLYIGGCSLYGHWLNISDDANAYKYYKNTSGSWITTENVSVSTALKEENWNLITLQQGSTQSGKEDTYEPYLSDIIDYINDNKTNENAKIAWHMTWAYAQDSSIEDYNNDQLTMYNSIVSAVKSKVLTNDKISYVIPVGTTLQNVRTSMVGDTLNRDGKHLEIRYASYVASLTWFYKITGLPMKAITYKDAAYNDVFYNRPYYYLKVAEECVANALENPHEIKQSQYVANSIPEVLCNKIDFENADVGTIEDDDFAALGICAYTDHNANMSIVDLSDDAMFGKMGKVLKWKPISSETEKKENWLTIPISHVLNPNESLVVEYDYRWVATSRADSFGGTWGDIGLLTGTAQNLNGGGKGWIHKYHSKDTDKFFNLGNSSATNYCQINDWLHVKNVYDYDSYLKDVTSTDAVQVSVTKISNGGVVLSGKLPLGDTTVNPLVFQNANGLGEIYLDNISVYKVPKLVVKSTSIKVGEENVPSDIKKLTINLSNKLQKADSVVVTKNGTAIGNSEFFAEIVDDDIVVSFADDLEYSAGYEIKVSGIVDVYEQTILEISIPFTVENAPEIALQDLRISKGIGMSYEKVSDIEATNALQSVSLDLKNTTETKKDVNVILAFYDGVTGRFIDIMSAKTSISAFDEKTITIGTDFSMSKGEVVKAFVWEGFSTIKPWIDAIQMEIK